MKILSVAVISFTLTAGTGGSVCAAGLPDTVGKVDRAGSAARSQNLTELNREAKLFEVENLVLPASPVLPAIPQAEKKPYAGKGAVDFAPIRLTDKLRLGGVSNLAGSPFKHLGGMATPAGFLVQYNGPVGLNMMLLPPTASNDAAVSVQLKYRY